MAPGRSFSFLFLILSLSFLLSFCQHKEETYNVLSLQDKLCFKYQRASLHTHSFLVPTQLSIHVLLPKSLKVWVQWIIGLGGCVIETCKSQSQQSCCLVLPFFNILVLQTMLEVKTHRELVSSQTGFQH